MAHCCCTGVDLVCENGRGRGEGDGAGKGEGAGRGACCEGCRGGGAVSGKGSFVSGRLLRCSRNGGHGVRLGNACVG